MSALAATASACSCSFVRLGRVAAPAPRKDLAASRHAGGVGQRFVRHAKKQRVGVPLGLAPVLVKERPLDRQAPEPEVVVADGVLQRLPHHLPFSRRRVER